MENNQNHLQGEEHQDDKGQKINFTHDNRDLKENREHPAPDGQLPEDDPALINPDELATFPREVKNDDPDIEEERDSHLTNRKPSPARDGRNITRTDTTPDNNGGFM